MRLPFVKVFNSSEMQPGEDPAFTSPQRYPMLDYWKLWIYDMPTIETLLNYPLLNRVTTIDDNGILKGICGTYRGWKLETLSYPYRLQITGSIHKFWNGGTNENDFVFSQAIKAVANFCLLFQVNPGAAHIKNLEFGVNLQLSVNASEIIDQIICYNYSQPLRPYSLKTDAYFIEFEQWEYYLKVYDKGKQYRSKIPHTPNTLRLEAKSVNARILRTLGVQTLQDLLHEQNLQNLGEKLATLLKGLVFDDDTIELKYLSRKERELYKSLSNPRNWKTLKGATTSTTRKKIARFKSLVEEHGKRKIYTLVSNAVRDKIATLSENQKGAVFHPKYSKKTGALDLLDTIKKKVCRSCGKDISHQHPRSTFCSARFVGEWAAHRCRNQASNARNNPKRKLARMRGNGLLLTIEPPKQNTA